MSNTAFRPPTTSDPLSCLPGGRITASCYAQLFLHGGEDDFFEISALQLAFNEAAINDSVMLGGKGHDTILCDHGLGHTVPSDMYADRLVEFFADHPLGTEVSPYNDDGLPAGFADYCEFVPAAD